MLAFSATAPIRAWPATDKTIKILIAELGPVNTYAITATVVANRQCNEEGASQGGFPWRDDRGGRRTYDSMS